jgi:hypothetical protein
MELLRRGELTRDLPIVLTFDHEHTRMGQRIRCPKCQWQPSRGDQWMCVSQGAPEYFEAGCGTAWHTFDTAGVCPGCQHQWHWTSCFGCHQWSPHEEWYEEEDQL